MNKIEIVIGDKKYNVRTDESPEYVKNIENIINEQINIITNSNKRFNEIDKLILSSFVIVDKYIKLNNEINDYKKEICEEIQNLKQEKEVAIREKEETLKEASEAILEKERYREKLLARDNDREYLNSQISKQQDKINEQEQQLLKSEMLINELKNKNEELEEAIEELRIERENFTKELSFMNNTKSSLNGRISKLQLKLNEKEQSILQLEKAIRDLKSTGDEKTQKIYNINDENQKLNLIIESKQSDIESLNNKINVLQNKIYEKDGIINGKDKAIVEYKYSADELKKKYDIINDEREKYLEELLMLNNDKENLMNSINELQEKLNRKEAENFQNQLEITKLKKDNMELLDLLDRETSV
ncbi:cell division protein ZapA [Sedimentibacter sp.]|uniref:cell division protein ZapA n=1 Tax=Sedimentibacter sp. TaxID=1960295 RepID=UPI0028A968FF|nr:cell division protein ZapA [Sedimentibacter sp.]